ncbi:MAG: hypothetical protein JW829_20670 [Pirellulales bacterium]|nr:hypothetical protein [Pirellulales bacterium]
MVLLTPGGNRWHAVKSRRGVSAYQLQISRLYMSDDFKKIAASEIAEFKAEYRQRFPDRDVEKLTDEDLLREVMNTIGKPGKLGEHIRCVVSVSMLTEGWDANTVTHILGIRAFGTQLLCEQVVGRGLRRRSYHAVPHTLELPDGRGTCEFDAFPVEYAEVYGVPFSFIPCSGSTTDPKPGPIPTRVRALEERIACEITFPRIDGYRYELPAERFTAKFSADSQMALTTADVPTKVECDPIVGERAIHTLDDLKARREQEIVFVIARRVLEKYFRDDDGNPRVWVFPDLARIFHTVDWQPLFAIRFFGGGTIQANGLFRRKRPPFPRGENRVVGEVMATAKGGFARFAVGGEWFETFAAADSQD